MTVKIVVVLLIFVLITLICNFLVCLRWFKNANAKEEAVLSTKKQATEGGLYNKMLKSIMKKKQNAGTIITVNPVEPKTNQERKPTIKPFVKPE